MSFRRHQGTNMSWHEHRPTLVILLTRQTSPFLAHRIFCHRSEILVMFGRSASHLTQISEYSQERRSGLTSQNCDNTVKETCRSHHTVVPIPANEILQVATICKIDCC